MENHSDNAEQWAVVELMGHVRIAGRLSEVEKFGAKMGQLDIPKGDGFYTRLFGGPSVYSITLVTEEVARLIAERSDTPPLRSWEMPKQIAAPAERQRPFIDNPESDDDPDKIGY